MMKRNADRQIDLFNCDPIASSPRPDALGTLGTKEAGLALSFDEALANAHAFIISDVAETNSAADTSNTNDGIFRSKPVHLPDRPEGPEIYALCPGCELHPGGGIFPAAELRRAEGCPTGERLAMTAASGETPVGGSASWPAGKANDPIFGKGRCRGADREGLALSGTERPDVSLPFLFPNFSAASVATVAASALAAAGFALTTPWRLCSGAWDGALRRLRRVWYFHRRRAICRDRLSQIANSPSLTS